MSRRRYSEIKVILDHFTNTLYPVVKAEASNGWKIQAVYNHVIRQREHIGYYSDRPWDTIEKIEESFGIKFKELNGILPYQYDVKSVCFNDNGLYYGDLSSKVKKSLSVHYSGMNGTIPIERHSFKMDLSIFRLPEVKKYFPCDIEEDIIDINIYDYMLIDYEWKENTVKTTTYSIFNDGHPLVTKKFKCQREGVAYAYDIFEHYKQKFPEIMMEFLL